MKACSIVGCAETYYSKGFCKRHYDKNRRRGNPLFEEVFAKDSPCTVEGCSALQRSKGLCGNHYMQLLRKDPELKAKSAEWNKLWRKNNPGALAKNQALYRQRHKEELSNYYKAWRAENRASFNAYQKSRKRRVRSQMPAWVNEKELRSIYLNCPKGFHVDHIIPVNGRNVSGLHVPWNLQYLPALENLRKSNRVIGA